MGEFGFVWLGFGERIVKGEQNGNFRSIYLDELQLWQVFFIEDDIVEDGT